MRWAALDVETATADRGSICSIGVVVVDDGQERYRQTWLVQPPANRYHPRNIAVHGITPSHTEYAPSFGEVWGEVEALMGGRPMVAHNAAFDSSAIRAACDQAGIRPPALDVVCSLAVARRCWPELSSHKLPIVAAHIGVEVQHHDALSDAAAASAIIGAAAVEHEADSLGALLEAVGVSVKQLAPGVHPTLAPH